jgi:predicted nucleic acid-binding protein
LSSYWDSSALIKLYAAEDDSAYFDRVLVESREPAYSSSITAVEVSSTLFRKEAQGTEYPGSAITAIRRFRQDCTAGKIILLPCGQDVIDEAQRLAEVAFQQHRPVMIRSIDLIHVASASVAKATRIVATDKRLREFAGLLKVRLLP